jgi:hypothetical protein
MRRRRLGLVIAILAIAGAVDLRAAGFTGAPACPSNGTLATLISFNSNLIPGCTIHGLTYSGFSWTQTGTNALTPNSVNYSVNNSLGILDFASSLFTVTGSDTLIYTLEYVVDPPPISLRRGSVHRDPHRAGIRANPDNDLSWRCFRRVHMFHHDYQRPDIPQRFAERHDSTSRFDDFCATERDWRHDDHRSGS